MTEFENYLIESVDAEDRVSIKIGLIADHAGARTYLSRLGVSNAQEQVDLVVKTGQRRGGALLPPVQSGGTAPEREIDPLTGEVSERVGSTQRVSSSVSNASSAPVRTQEKDSL